MRLFETSSHGWRVKRLKLPVAVGPAKPWTPGPHNCGSKGGCFCSGACMPRPEGLLAGLSKRGNIAVSISAYVANKEIHGVERIG